MVIGVIYEIIRNGVTMAGVELFEKCLGNLLLLVAELRYKAIGLNLSVISHLIEVEVRKDRLDGIELVRTDGWLSGLTVFGVDVDVDPIIPDPFLGGRRDAGMTLGDPSMTAVDVRVRKPCARNPYSGSASSSAESVVSSRPTNAEGGALLPKVPSYSGKEFDTASESKKAHDE